MKKRILLICAILFFFTEFLLADEFPTQRKNFQLMGMLDYQSQHGSWCEDRNGNGSNQLQAEIGIGYFFIDNLMAGLSFSLGAVDSSTDNFGVMVIKASMRIEYYLRDLFNIINEKNLNNFIPYLFVSGNHRHSYLNETHYKGTPAEYSKSFIADIYGYGFGIGMLIMLNKHVGLKPFFSYNVEYITQKTSSIELNESEKSSGKGYILSPGLWVVGVIY